MNQDTSTSSLTAAGIRHPAAQKTAGLRTLGQMRNVLRAFDIVLPDPLGGVAGEYLTDMAGQRHRRWMNELLVGYARVSTEQQDLTAQRNGLHALGVGDDRIYVDHGLTGTNHDRPGLKTGAGRLPSR